MPEKTNKDQKRGIGFEPEIRRLYFPADDARASEGNSDGKIIEGHAAVYDKPAWINDWFGGYREYVRSSAFTKTIKDGADVRGLLNHIPSEIFARTKGAANLELSSDDIGLFYRATVIDQTGEKVHEKVRTKLITQNSFGFRVLKDRWYKEQITDAAGKTVEVDARELLEVKLFDISPVTYAAYEETDASARSAQIIQSAVFSTFMRSMLATGEIPEQIREDKNSLKEIKDVLESLVRGLEPSDNHSTIQEPGLLDTLALRQAQVDLEVMLK